jgi:hypothetical protein
MLLGAATGLVATLGDRLHPAESVIVLAFAGGALFGKGYGLHEAREVRRKAQFED